MTEIFELADRVVEGTAQDDPIAATFYGVPGHDDRLTDFSPAAEDGRNARVAGWLTDLDRLPVEQAEDRLAAAHLRERLGVRRSMFEARDHLRDCNTLGSPLQGVQRVFSLMPVATDDHWEQIASRLGAVPSALGTLVCAYREGIAAGLVPARRQVLGAARSAAVCAGSEPGSSPWFAGLAAGYDGVDGALRERLDTAADRAGLAYSELATWMRAEYATAATPVDAVGEERYVRAARMYTGTDLDLHDTYRWGWSEVEWIAERMVRCAGELYGGVSPAEAQHRLDVDPDHTIVGAEQTRDWLQALTDRTTASFQGRYFDIPEQMLTCEAMLAPPGGALAPYYTPPSEDFSRPGRTWLPVDGQERFRTWWLTSVWYHEAVPGHHLQLGYAKLQHDRLSRFQRIEVVSGHAEGWALYAERLMDELGYFDHPAIELGFLSAQMLRAIRVVVDIGMHLELPVPADVAAAALAPLSGDPRGSVVDDALARELLTNVAILPDAFAASEVDRYLGLPGQAICYKVGERVWLQAREAARASAGADFDLKAWHMRALGLGSVGLDLLAAELAR